MKALVANAQPGDVLVFHYSGHGVQVPDLNYDELSGYDDALIPTDYVLNGVITDDTIFRDFIAKVPAGVKLIAFFDCCHSGSICDLEFNTKYVGSPSDINARSIAIVDSEFKSWRENNNVVEGDVFVFSGCYDEQTSADASIENQRQGAFTYTLHEAIMDPSHAYTCKELLKHINLKLQSSGYDQRSQLSCSKESFFDDVFSF